MIISVVLVGFFFLSLNDPIESVKPCGMVDSGRILDDYRFMGFSEILERLQRLLLIGWNLFENVLDSQKSKFVRFYQVDV